MLTINSSYNDSSKPIFRSNLHYKAVSKSQSYVLHGESASQLSLLKLICKEVFQKLQNNASLIQEVTGKLKNVFIAENIIKFSVKDLENVILSMPQGLEADLFRVQRFVDDQTVGALTFDNCNRVLKNDKKKSSSFLTKSEAENIDIEKFISQVYDSVDGQMLQLRIATKNIPNTYVAPKQDVSVKNVDSKNNKKNVAEENSSLVILSSEKWNDFSMPEYIKAHSIVSIPNPQVEVGIGNQKETISSSKTVKRERVNSVVNKKTHSATTKLSVRGKINKDLVGKLDLIRSLFDEIKTDIDNSKNITSRKISRAYSDFIKLGSRSLTFKDFRIFIPKIKKFEEYQIIALTDNLSGETIGITKDGKIISKGLLYEIVPNKNDITPSVSLSGDNQNNNFLGTFLDKILSELDSFSNYIKKGGWQRTLESCNKNAGVLDSETMRSLRKVIGLYNQIELSSKTLSHKNYLKVRKQFGKIFCSKSHRLEFINPMEDNMNVLFDISESRYGTLYKIAKHSGQKIIEEIYCVTPDGKIVKNIVKNFGLERFLPTSIIQKLRFFTANELQESGIENNIQSLLNVLEKNLDEFEKYLIEYIKEKNLV